MPGEKPHESSDAVHARHPHIKFPHITFRRHELEDRPLAGQPHPDHLLHWKLYGCEAIATAILMFIGVVSNTLIAAPASPLARIFAGHPGWQTALCGLFFGSAGTVAAMTPFGRVSGAHLSPSITLAFTIAQRIKPLDAGGYVIAQLLGAGLGTGIAALFGYIIPAWTAMLDSVHYTSTLPSAQVSVWISVLTEGVLTAGLVLAIYWCAAHKRLHLITPWVGGIYFLIANPLIGWITGDSTNFARSVAPALYDGNISSLWIYFVGPLAGSSIAVGLIKSGIFGRIHLLEARIINFGHHGRVPRLSEPAATGPKPAANTAE